MSLADASGREAAIDPTCSVCISAPAGSGKTSLLVQRFLSLLARVEDPEHLVAITFTRKAAAEMRARVVRALTEAAETGAEAGPGPTDPGAAFESALRQTATHALTHSETRGWDLINNPARLSIQTIDSFCGDLTRQMPVLSGFGGGIAPSDDAAPLYDLAVERFLKRHLAGDNSTRTDLERLLLHLDNRWDSASALLTQLLQRREQWQPIFGVQGLAEEQRPALTQALADLTAHRLAKLQADLAAFLPTLEDMVSWRSASAPQLPTIDFESEDLAAWRPLADLLLTKPGAWRKTVTKNDGFPAGKGEPAEKKAQMLSLLEELAAEADDALRQALIDLRLLPLAEEEGEHWEILLALTRLLPRLVAELLLVFQERGEVDHAQIAMAALAALGSDDSPTDLALRLDHRIEHLLVDEFQDTSSLQFELLRRLTRGWADHNEAQPEAPRTLLVVGDPMQSIYGFREANVGLFIQARDQGIGDLCLEPIELSVNFRSASSIVDWTNARFSNVFPRADDPELGAVRCRPAVGARAPGSEPVVNLFCGDGAEAAEIEALCDAVERGLGDTQTQSMAILGRSRTHLRPFLAALRARNIEYAAQDFDALDAGPVVRDLMALTAMLFEPLDRYAWLCFLRTPSIALTNADLLLLVSTASSTNAFRSVRDPKAFDQLSEAGRERITWLRDVLAWSEHYRDRLAPRVWIEETWLRLGGAGTLSDVGSFANAREFFSLIEALGSDPRGLSLQNLEDALGKLYARTGDARSRLQVMTLHKAKGLEFDRVFIPALGRGTRSSDSPLLLWDEIALPGRPPTILIDVRDAVGGKHPDQLYSFLKRQQERKRDLESARLLYVGCTRAEDHLWLSGCLAVKPGSDEPSPPRSGSLLAHLWPGLDPVPDVSWVDHEEAEEAVVLPYRRLSVPSAEIPPKDASAARGIAHVDNLQARALGTAIHRVLESQAYRGELPRAMDSSMRSLLRVSLIESGTDRRSLAEQCEKGAVLLQRCFEDSWLRWALDPGHRARHAEHPVSLVDAEGADKMTRDLVVDYTFLDAATGDRWIVDYKTSAPSPLESPEEFMATEAERYSPQMSAYADALTCLGPEPIRCALYFPNLGRHIELFDKRED